MKPLYRITLFVCLMLISCIVIACGSSPTPTPVPTLVPTPVPPTTAPTIIPPTAAPTKTTAPTNTPSASTSGGSDIPAVQRAFEKFLAATTFRLSTDVTTSPALFEPQYTPQPGDDPDRVTVVSMQGEQDNANFDFKLRGFAASFLAVIAGFDPNSAELELASVGDARFARGIKEGETTAKWYQFPQDDPSMDGFVPRQILAPIINAKYADDAFQSTGSETMDGQQCAVFEGDRAAFELVLPELSDSALLNSEVFDKDTIDNFKFQVWVCGDGQVHRILYAFDTHTKKDAAEKGSLSFDAKIKDYDTTIVIQAPADAIPLDSGAANAQPTEEATNVSEAKTFTSLEGDWEGNSSTDSPIQFTVEDNALTFVMLNYSINTGSCSVGGAYGRSVDDGAINNDKFAFTLTNDDGVQFTFAGKFNSNNDAEGTLAIKGKTHCGDTDEQVTWTAKHISAPESSTEPTSESSVEPTEEATVEATAEATTEAGGASGDAVALVQSAFDAFAKKDLNTALAAFDDDVVYSVGDTSGVGKASLQSYLQLALAAGSTFAVSNVQDLGGIVTFTVTVSGVGAGTYSNSSAIVDEGKIVLLTLK